MEKKKGIIDRFFKEPVEKLSNLTWKLSAFGAIVATAIGKFHPALTLAMISVAGLIINNEAAHSMQKSPT